MNARALFDEHATQQPQSPSAQHPHPPPAQYHHSPPLPPTPAGEVALEISYGSKSTKVASVPAKLQTPPPPGSPQDFTPRLPPRPATSIHPSSRGLPTSPPRRRAELPPPTTITTQSSLSAPSSPSPASTTFDTDDWLSYHDPEPSGDREPAREPSTSAAPTLNPQPPPTLRKTELPPTPKESPATSAFEPNTDGSNQFLH